MSTLSNVTIIKEMKNGRLVLGGNNKNVGAAYYELQMGNVFYDLTESDKPIELKYNEKVIIKPGHRVVLITKEDLRIPNNVFARVISKGSLFSIGLSPVSTNADPGFNGKLGIVTQNFSDKYIVIPQNEGIAKVDFSLLDIESTKPYIGQHGFQTKIWPIKHQYQKDHSDVKNEFRVKDENSEAHKVLPKLISDSLLKLESGQRKINFGLFIFLAISIGMLGAVSTDFFDPIIAFSVNIGTSLILWLYMKFTS